MAPPAVQGDPLSTRWLYLQPQVEPHDLDVLHQCEENIVLPGGAILLGLHQDRVVASLAFMSLEEEGSYELGKMAVEPRLQGLGLGQRLLKEGLGLAKSRGWRRLVIYSCRSLQNALHIYLKAGFVEVSSGSVIYIKTKSYYYKVPLESSNPYERADIKLILELGSSKL